MKNVIEKLIEYNQQINLSERSQSYGFDINDGLFNFSEKELLSKGKNSFEKNILLKQILCDFIKQNHLTICGINSKPFYLELLLFTLADKEIFEDIKLNAKLNLYNS
ncbi:MULTISPECIES: hypothetical protein [Flavobacterium]|uniref:Uncharacterized protein n=2 Tax=Flavobacterium TaxID=237 RepID=A0ABW8PR05_9FLAO|nr:MULTISPECIES: hypothetical protein [Flavobacterium]QYS89374.1 hypothetical protein JJC05_03230 [Flavobacterium davisii]SPE76132.1 hypothetical protein FLACOL_00110 [Flavobacterium columnare]